MLKKRFHSFDGLVLLVFIICVRVPVARGEDETVLESRYVAGLVGRYSSLSGESVERIDSTLGGWLDSRPLPGLPAVPSRVAWNGFLFVQPEGTFRFYGYVRGSLRLTVDGKQRLDIKTAEPAWVGSEPMELEFGWRPFQLEYQGSDERPTFKFAWSGPGFDQEPIPAHSLFHDANANVDTRWQQGAELARRLQCQACHEMDGMGAIVRAPSLTNLSGNLSRVWLIDRLAKHEDQTVRSMPDFALTRTQAMEVADYLLSFADKSNPPHEAQGDAAAGKSLFMTIGCLACHRVDQMGPPIGPNVRDLSDVASKRSPGFLSVYLHAPQRVNPDHQMPVFDLAREERNDLTAYLLTLQRADTKEVFSSSSCSTRGRSLVQGFRCANCHQLPQEASAAVRQAAPQSLDSKHSCLGRADPTRFRPGFQLSKAERAAIKAFFSIGHAHPNRLDPLVLLERRGCVLCHPRGTGMGITDSVLQVAATHRELASLTSAMVPPSLNQIGDKLHDNAFVTAIEGQDQPRRPWLRVRMPRFRFEAGEVDALMRGLRSHDRFPVQPDMRNSADVKDQLSHAGKRLVTSNGFGCTSCHAVGDVKPPDAPLNARGPDLALLAPRIRRSWFDRWIRNPARVVPHIEMPSITQPVPGVLDDQLKQQMAAVWHVLNQPDFRPPEADAIRVVRLSGNGKQSSIALTDVLNVREHTFVKPFLIALPNRHNLLYDLQTGRLAEWTIGDAARQRTNGKSWFWDLAGTRIVSDDSPQSDIALRRNDTIRYAITDHQFVTQADQWRHIDSGIELLTRFEFAGDQATKLQVTQRFSVSNYRPVSAWQRHVWFQGNSTGSVLLRVVPARHLDRARWSEDAREAWLGDRARVRILSPADARFDHQGFVVIGDVQQKTRLVLEYESQIDPDQFPVVSAVAETGTASEVNAVPGFAGIRLPIGDDMMPTGLSWSPDGSLYVSSLKGRIWRITDADGDGIEESASAFSDELAAPFGLAAHAGYVDVINKFGLLRLFDDDSNQRADRVVTLASGWGHTVDYHDWAIGLPSDEEGRYFVALACQQDDRPREAAHLRGRVIRLTPTTSDHATPMSYRIEQISAGHRFPMGIALSRSRQLFVTDNQGNYNPYNELNHVRKGAHFGFVNQLEAAADRPVVTAPAVKIPHPWTRSVNGICFLETPDSIGANHFGPFEGHLIGCEYDTRRLIRFSLQAVGNSIQGAAYPFSASAADDADGFLGPITCAISPQGELYIGDIRDSGWGGGQNIGALIRLTPNLAELPNGIAELRATSRGFTIKFVAPINELRAVDPKNYRVSSVTRTPTPAYGGSDQHRREEAIESIRRVDDTHVELTIGELRAGYVYEFHLRHLVTDEEIFYPDEAYYTLNEIP